MQFFVVFLFLFLPVDMITHCNNATVLSWSNNAGNLKVGRGKNQKEYTWGYVCVQEAAVQGVVDRPTWEEIFSYSEANAPNTFLPFIYHLTHFPHSFKSFLDSQPLTAYILGQPRYNLCHRHFKLCFIIVTQDMTHWNEEFMQCHFLGSNLACCLWECAKIDLFREDCQLYGPGNFQQLKLDIFPGYGLLFITMLGKRSSKKSRVQCVNTAI